MKITDIPNKTFDSDSIEIFDNNRNKTISNTVFPSKSDILAEAEKQIECWLKGNSEKEKDHYRVAFRRSYEYVIKRLKAL